jgi:hypothetical protein
VLILPVDNSRASPYSVKNFSVSPAGSSLFRPVPAGCALRAFAPITGIHFKEDGQMKRSWIGAVVALVMCGAFIGGCCCPGGGSSTTTSETNITTTTTGQQLIDLQKAYESGAISEKDYNKKKQEILDKSK